MVWPVRFFNDGDRAHERLLGVLRTPRALIRGRDGSEVFGKRRMIRALRSLAQLQGALEILDPLRSLAALDADGAESFNRIHQVEVVVTECGPLDLQRLRKEPLGVIELPPCERHEPQPFERALVLRVLRADGRFGAFASECISAVRLVEPLSSPLETTNRVQIPDHRRVIRAEIRLIELKGALKGGVGSRVIPCQAVGQSQIPEPDRDIVMRRSEELLADLERTFEQL